MNPRIKNVEVLENYKLLLTFKNGEKKIYDARNILKFDFYKNIRKEENFKKVKVVDGGITIEWETGEDIDPDELYVNSKFIEEEEYGKK